MAMLITFFTLSATREHSAASDFLYRGKSSVKSLVCVEHAHAHDT